MSLLKKYKSELISFIPFLLCAIFSEGFLHPDEHFQILELLNVLQGPFTIPEIFNWDYHEKIRPWFQIFIYHGLTKVFFFVESPFLQAFIIRLFNGIIGFIAIKTTISLFKDEIKSPKKALLILSYTWFIPFLLVRTNSESLSTSLFLLGAFFISKKQEFSYKSLSYSALFFGASFAVRYQMGIAIFFAGTFYLINNRSLKKFSYLIILMFAFIFSFSIFDYFGYGEKTFSAYNYFYTNLVEHRSKDFGVSPFWYYLTAPILKGIPPLSIFLLCSLILFWRKFPLSIYTSSTIGFLIIHSMIPHKEIRFLAFVYIFSAISLVIFFEKLTDGKFNKLFKFSFAINFLVLIKVSLTPAHSPIKLYKYLYDNQQINLLHTYKDSNGNYFKLTMPFYLKKQIKTIPINQLEGQKFLLTTKIEQLKKTQENSNCNKIFSIYPDFLLNLNIFNWTERSSIFAIWKCLEKSP